MFFNRRLFGRIKDVKDETVTTSSFTNATPQRKVLFYDRFTGQGDKFEGVITKVIYDQRINTTSVKTSLMETSIETRILKVDDLVIVKEDQILQEGSRFEHILILLTIDLNKTQGQCIGMKYIVTNYGIFIMKSKISYESVARTLRCKILLFLQGSEKRTKNSNWHGVILLRKVEQWQDYD